MPEDNYEGAVILDPVKSIHDNVTYSLGCCYPVLMIHERNINNQVLNDGKLSDSELGSDSINGSECMIDSDYRYEPEPKRRKI